MRPSTGQAPGLRIVRPGDSGGVAGVEKGEGHAIGHADARWVLAVRTACALQGGRAAVLTPEDRCRLVRRAEASGLSAFDAHLVIAIVQESVRRTGAPLGEDVVRRLRCVRPPQAAQAPVWVRAMSAVVLGAVLLTVLVRWVAGA